MANYVVVPYVGGKGWLMLSGKVNSLTYKWVSFLKKKAYNGCSIWDLRRVKTGKLEVEAKIKAQLIYKSPFEAIKRLAQELHSPIEKIGPKLYKMGATTIEISPKNAEGYAWEFQAK